MNSFVDFLLDIKITEHEILMKSVVSFSNNNNNNEIPKATPGLREHAAIACCI